MSHGSEMAGEGLADERFINFRLFLLTTALLSRLRGQLNLQFNQAIFPAIQQHIPQFVSLPSLRTNGVVRSRPHCASMLGA
jgi:hypothetical protein